MDTVCAAAISVEKSQELCSTLEDQGSFLKLFACFNFFNEAFHRQPCNGLILLYTYIVGTVGDRVRHLTRLNKDANAYNNTDRIGGCILR